MNVPAIILAKGEARNVMDFCGRPLVEWAIIQAKASNFITDVFISTDDDKIAEIGMENDISIIWRSEMPKDTPGDVPLNMAVEELQYMGYKFDIVVPILLTTPCRLPDDFDNAIELYYKYGESLQTHLMSFIKVQVCAMYDKGDTPLLYAIHSKEARKRGYMFVPNGHINVIPVSMIKKMEFKKAAENPNNWRETWRMEKKLERMFPAVIGYEMKQWQFVNVYGPEETAFNELIFQKFILDKGYYSG